MGIKRSAISNEVTVEENIKKAQKMLYSLMSSGLHGYNGLDPETGVHITNLCVTDFGLRTGNHTPREVVYGCVGEV